MKAKEEYNEEGFAITNLECKKVAWRL